MRLLQSVLATSPQTRKPQRKFIAHLLGLLLMLPGHATFRNLSRYSSYHERTFARWYDRHFDFVSLHKAAITQVIPPDHQQALVIDASFIPKSGTHTYGLERFWNSCHRRSEKGLEVSLLAWLDITGTCAYGLSVEQTPPSDKTAEPQGTRIDAYLEQLRHVVCDHHLKHLRYVIADGYYSKRKFLDGVRALGLHQMGKLRRDANLRYLYLGVGRPGPGRPKTYDGKVQWDDLSRFERVHSEDDGIVLYHQVLNHVHLRRNLRVVLVVEPLAKLRQFGLGAVVMRPYGESFAVGGSNCHEFSHGGAEFRLPSCDADATLPLRTGQQRVPGWRKRGRETSFRSPSASTDQP